MKISRQLKFTSILLLSALTLWTSAALAIDSPRNLRGTEVGQQKVKWEWDSTQGAEQYELIVDGVNVYTTSDTNYFTFNLWAGEHSLTVRSKSSNGEFSEPTPTAKIIVSDWFNAGNYNRSYIVGQENNSTRPAKTLAAPVAQPSTYDSVVGVNGVIIDTGTVKWEWSNYPDAVAYEVTVDGGYSGSTQDTSFISDGLWEGDHSMTVVAIKSNGEKTVQSETVKLWVGANVLAIAQNEPVFGRTFKVGDVASPPPLENLVGLASGRTMVDPASYDFNEVYDRFGYELVFSDEFEDSTLNSFRWNTGLRWDGEYNGERYEYRVINGEEQLYVNIYSEDKEHIRDVVPTHNPFELDGSRLAIRAIKNPLKTNNNNLAYGSMNEIASQQNFLSGAIATHDKFSQKFGYFEARIKIPSHVGAFPAFWLFHENSVAEGTQKTEIDIMENLGHAPWYVYNTFHYYKNVSLDNGGDYNFIKPYPDGQIFTGTDYSKDYHVYAVEWEPGRITWFIDGVKVSEFESNEVNYEDLYVKLNLAIGGEWTSFPTNAGGLGRPYPNQFDLDNFQNPALEIDYVRVYQKK